LMLFLADELPQRWNPDAVPATSGFQRCPCRATLAQHQRANDAVIQRSAPARAPVPAAQSLRDGAGLLVGQAG
jgi:hypothetical protein